MTHAFGPRLRLVVALPFFLLPAAGAALATPADGEVLGATKIVDNGPDSDRFVIVLVAEGYQEAELDAFATRAQEFVDAMFATPPFDTNCSAINVWRIDVASVDSGADDPAPPEDDPETPEDESSRCAAGAGGTADTFFDASFCGDGVISRLLRIDSGTAIDVLNEQVPQWNQALLIVNSEVYGGGGGNPGVTSVSGQWKDVAIHELGHSAFGLGDEYDYFRGCDSGETDRDNHPDTEPSEPNVTTESDRDLIEWAGLIGEDTPVPTTMNADCTVCDPQPDPFPGEQVVGAYEGAHYYHCDAYRPVFRCMMRDFSPFCPVCTRAILDTLEVHQPENTPPECDPGGPYVAECSGAATAVSLDASGSSDVDCDPLEFAWSGDFIGGMASGAQVTVEFESAGEYEVTLEVSDGEATTECTVVVTIEDTVPPELTAPEDVVAECSSHEGTPVALGEAVASDGCDPDVAITHDAPDLFPLGETVVTWTATDASGNSATDTQRVTVVDTTPPDVVVRLSPAELWPPNHKLVAVTAELDIADACDPEPVVELASVTSNQADNGRGDGNTTRDVQGAEIGTDDRELLLRAERGATIRSDRVYTVTYVVTDASGNATEAWASVRVRHDRRR